MYIIYIYIYIHVYVYQDRPSFTIRNLYRLPRKSVSSEPGSLSSCQRYRLEGAGRRVPRWRCQAWTAAGGPEQSCCIRVSDAYVRAYVYIYICYIFIYTYMYRNIYIYQICIFINMHKDILKQIDR